MYLHIQTHTCASVHTPHAYTQEIIAYWPFLLFKNLGLVLLTDFSGMIKQYIAILIYI